MTENVIPFPKGKKNTPPQSVEEAVASVEAIRKGHIDFLADECCTFIFHRLYDEGFDLGEEQSAKNCALIIEAMKSAMCAIVDIPHPLQALSDKMFQFDGEGSVVNEIVSVDGLQETKE